MSTLTMKLQNAIVIVETESIASKRSADFEPNKELVLQINRIKANPTQFKGKSLLFNLSKEVVETTHRNRFNAWIKANNLDKLFKLSVRQIPNGYDGYTLQLKVQ